jgi:hypothetical protein
MPRPGRSIEHGGEVSNLLAVAGNEQIFNRHGQTRVGYHFHSSWPGLTRPSVFLAADKRFRIVVLVDLATRELEGVALSDISF